MPDKYPINHHVLAEDYRDENQHFSQADARWLLDSLRKMCNAYDAIVDERRGYHEALVIFRDLCDDAINAGLSNEYVRGGVNLIADMYAVVGRPVDERMDDVLADLRRIPMFADPNNLAQYGVMPYEHNGQEQHA